MKQLRCIVVDDEPSSREIVECYVNDCPQLVLIGSCKNAFEAKQMLNEKDIDLLFLDINMPKLSGMMFYKSLIHAPMVIFTTAYPQYAVEGFEVNAIDYLLKPFSIERFLKAVNKAVAYKQDDTEQKYILLKADKKVHRILIDDITYLMALGDYVKVFYADKHIMVHSTFQDMLDQLDANKFIRVHKSYAVALDEIEVIEGAKLIMKSGELPIGGSYRTALMNKIKP